MLAYVTARRVALFCLFFALSVLGAVGTASAMVPDPRPDGATDSAGGAAAVSGSALQPWVIVGLVVSVVAVGAIATALGRSRGSRPATLASS